MAHKGKECQMVGKVLQSMGKVGDYEIRLLRVFKTVVECGGFSAAEVG